MQPLIPMRITTITVTVILLFKRKQRELLVSYERLVSDSMSKIN